MKAFWTTFLLVTSIATLAFAGGGRTRLLMGQNNTAVGTKVCGVGSFITTLNGDNSVCAGALVQADGGVFVGVDSVTGTSPIISSGGTDPVISFDLPSVISPTDGGWTLYVNGSTGSDLNASCFATGAGACSTIQGALNKAPKYLRHQLTVNVAAGNYAGFTVSGFVIDPGTQRVNAGILINGALANVTPTTGSASGTATGGTAGSGSTFGTLVDSGATWTINDTALVGKLVVITGGTGSGQVRVITSNTATTLNVAGTWTATTGTSTYVIQSPSVIITSAAAAIPKPQTGAEIAAAGIQLLDNVTVGSRITIENIAVSIAATQGVITSSTGTVELLQDTTTTTSGVAVSVGTGTALTLTNSAITVSSGVSAVSAVAHGGIATIANLYVSGGGIVLRSVSGGSISGLYSASLIGLNVQNGTYTAVISMRCDCASVSNSVCLSVGSSVSTFLTTGVGVIGSLLLNGNVNVTNCTYGLFNSGGYVHFGSTVVMSGNALTTAIMSVNSGKVYLSPQVQTITGVTSETSVDNGEATRAFSAYSGSYDCLNNLSTNSGVCRL